ncbi:hypothetical protein HYPSUDRAFT_1013699, partial [Hypholoma sublateritium FD-334 SS-4]
WFRTLFGQRHAYYHLRPAHGQHAVRPFLSSIPRSSSRTAHHVRPPSTVLRTVVRRRPPTPFPRSRVLAVHPLASVLRGMNVVCRPRDARPVGARLRRDLPYRLVSTPMSAHRRSTAYSQPALSRPHAFTPPPLCPAARRLPGFLRLSICRCPDRAAAGAAHCSTARLPRVPKTPTRSIFV